MTGIIIFLIIFIFAYIGITIWGIVAAAKTQDTKIRIGRLLLHLFLWGFLIAAIVYLVKCNNNTSNAALNMQANIYQQQMNNFNNSQDPKDQFPQNPNP